MKLLQERQKSTEQQEIEALTEQLIKMKQLLKENQRPSVNRLLEEKDRELNRLREFEHAHQSLQDQIQGLKQKLDNATTEQQKQMREASLRHQDSLDCIEKLLDSAANDKEERRLLLDKISHLDQELGSMVQQNQLIAENLQGAIALREDFKQALEKREEELAKTQGLCQELEGRLQEQTEKREKASQAQQEAEQTLRQLGEQALQRNQKIEALTSQITSLDTERLKWDEQLARTKRNLEERDAEIKMAQQHLAKKVKESSRLTELQEEAERRADRLQAELNEQRSAMDGLKAEVSRLQRREKQLHDQLQDQAHAAETKSARWDEEHLKITTQLKIALVQVGKLQQLAEKHAELRRLFDSIEELTADPNIKGLLPSHAEEPIQIPDLFSLPKTPIRVRQNLFEP